MRSPSTIELTADAVRRALASYPPFRHAATETAVKTSADRIELYGFVRSEAVANSALALARTTAGPIAVSYTHLKAGAQRGVLYLLQRRFGASLVQEEDLFTGSDAQRGDHEIVIVIVN